MYLTDAARNAIDDIQGLIGASMEHRITRRLPPFGGKITLYKKK